MTPKKDPAAVAGDRVEDAHRGAGDYTSFSVAPNAAASVTGRRLRLCADTDARYVELDRRVDLAEGEGLFGPRWEEFGRQLLQERRPGGDGFGVWSA